MEDRQYPDGTIANFFYALCPWSDNVLMRSLHSAYFLKLLKSLTHSLAGVEWSEVDMLHPDFGMPDASIPRPQTPPSGTTEVPNPVDSANG